MGRGVGVVVGCGVAVAVGTRVGVLVVVEVVGWLVGGWDYGLLIGAIAGIPLGVGAVYAVFGRGQGSR